MYWLVDKVSIKRQIFKTQFHEDLQTLFMFK